MWITIKWELLYGNYLCMRIYIYMGIMNGNYSWVYIYIYIYTLLYIPINIHPLVIHHSIGLYPHEFTISSRNRTWGRLPWASAGLATWRSSRSPRGGGKSWQKCKIHGKFRKTLAWDINDITSNVTYIYIIIYIYIYTYILYIYIHIYIIYIYTYVTYIYIYIQ